MSHVSRLPILDRAIAERTWTKPSAPALDHHTKDVSTSTAVYQPYTVLDMLQELKA